MTKRCCCQAAAPFWSATRPRPRLMPLPAPSRDRSCKVGERQRTGWPRANLDRGGRRLPAVRSTAMSAASGPRLPSWLPLPYDLLCGNVPRERPRGLRPRRDRGQRPGRRMLRGLASGGARSLLPRRQGLVREEVLPGGSTALSASRVSSGHQRSLVRSARSRLLSSRHGGVVRGVVPPGGLVRRRPPSPPASCRGRRPPALSPLPLPATSSTAMCPTNIRAASAREGRRPVRGSRADSCSAARARPLPLSPRPPPRPCAQARPARRFRDLVRGGDVPHGRPRDLAHGARSRLSPSPSFLPPRPHPR